MIWEAGNIIENEESTECEIVKEVREIQHQISARFNHDVGQLVAYYQALEQKMRQSGKYRFADLPNQKSNISEAANIEASD